MCRYFFRFLASKNHFRKGLCYGMFDRTVHFGKHPPGSSFMLMEIHAGDFPPDDVPENLVFRTVEKKKKRQSKRSENGLSNALANASSRILIWVR